jgi:hypothetical protein
MHIAGGAREHANTFKAGVKQGDLDIVNDLDTGEGVLLDVLLSGT